MSEQKVSAVPLPPKTIDLSGRRCGRLEVSEWSYVEGGERYWICDCSCGKILPILGSSLLSGRCRSCGCLRKENIRALGAKGATHKASKTPEFKIWSSMLNRCKSDHPNTAGRYKNRGITVCDRWDGPEGFANFLSDMGLRPSPKHSIDRIDNDKGYSPENCRWATAVQQCNNKSNNRRLTAFGRTQTLAEWAREVDMSPEAIAVRLKWGWEPEDALSIPIRESINPKRLSNGVHHSELSGESDLGSRQAAAD